MKINKDNLSKSLFIILNMFLILTLITINLKNIQSYNAVLKSLKVIERNDEIIKRNDEVIKTNQEIIIQSKDVIKDINDKLNK